MNALQHYLQNNGTLDELKEKFAISHSRHKLYPNLVLLKYSQIESPFAELIVQEARGIILDENDNWRIILPRYKKFFNYGEGHAAIIDWTTARVQEKKDGSLCSLYFWDNKWHIATSGSADASGQVGDNDFTFAELFWKTFNEMGLKVPDDTTLCPSFELTSKFNRVVVPHKESSLTFIGLHSTIDGEISIDRMSDCYPAVKSFSLSSFDEILESFSHIDPLSQEGYVIVDANFNRVKCKHSGYIALHHLKDSFGPRRIVEVIRSSEKSEVLTYFPEWTEQFNDSQEKYDALVNETNNLYEQLKTIEIQKDFALAVYANKVKLPAALFQLRAGKIDSVKQFIADMSIQNLMSILKIGEQECSHML